MNQQTAKLIQYAELKEINGNKQFLLKKAGFNSINEAKRAYGGEKADVVYGMLLNDYNRINQIENARLRKIYNIKKTQEFLTLFEQNKKKSIVSGKKAKVILIKENLIIPFVELEESITKWNLKKNKSKLVFLR